MEQVPSALTPGPETLAFTIRVRGRQCVKTELAIDGTRFLINGRPTHEGVEWRGTSVEGLLLNSRMIQGVFDDANPVTRELWRYPDTGVWDPDRNTGEFCAALPEYRRHGLLAVTVGLQGGGSVYTRDVYESYECSAYEPDGTFRLPFFDRLLRVLGAADECGMVVIVNMFYVKHARRIDPAKVSGVVERTADWLLGTGFRNIIIDLANEAADWWKQTTFAPANIHKLIEAAQSVTRDGRRLIVGSSSAGGEELPHGRWLEVEDVSMPHGNGHDPDTLARKVRDLRADDIFKKRPRPVLINEDGIFVDNLDAAVAEGASWGFYCQGYGSAYRDRMDWTGRPREDRYEDLSGFQTLPVNWSINTPVKRAFFDRVREITRGT